MYAYKHKVNNPQPLPIELTEEDPLHCKSNS